MKLTKETLKRIIKEELSAVLREEESSAEEQAKQFSNQIADEIAAGLGQKAQGAYNWSATDYGDLIELDAMIPNVGHIEISLVSDGTPMSGADVQLNNQKQPGVSPGSQELKQLIANLRRKMSSSLPNVNP
jgi:hypothetical protein